MRRNKKHKENECFELLGAILEYLIDLIPSYNLLDPFGEHLGAILGPSSPGPSLLSASFQLAFSLLPVCYQVARSFLSVSFLLCLDLAFR